MKVHIINDHKYARDTTEKLKKNNGYCPCRLEKTQNTKCMCKEFRESSVGTTCHCGLYIKVEK